MRFILTVSYILLLSAACTKTTSKNYLNGTVTEYGSGAPIEGATVIHQHWRPGFSGNPVYYDSVYTRSDGGFTVPEALKRGEEDWLYFRDNNHLGTNRQVGTPPFNVQLYAFSYVKVRARKRTNANTTIQINIGGDINSTGVYLDRKLPFDSVVSKPVRLRAYKEEVITWTISEKKTPYDPPANTTIRGLVPPINKGDTMTYFLEYD